MSRTDEIVKNLLRIRRARTLTERSDMSPDDIQLLRDRILELRRNVPPFALAHFDRLEASGKNGIARISDDGKCPVCGEILPKEEFDYLKTHRGIAVCEKCFAFLYIPDADIDELEESYFNRLLNR